MRDITERLEDSIRVLKTWSRDGHWLVMFRDAVDEIKRLRARVKRCEEIAEQNKTNYAEMKRYRDRDRDMFMMDLVDQHDRNARLRAELADVTRELKGFYDGGIYHCCDDPIHGMCDEEDCDLAAFRDAFTTCCRCMGCSDENALRRWKGGIEL